MEKLGICVVLFALLSAGGAVPLESPTGLPAGFREDFRITLETGQIGPIVEEVCNDVSLAEVLMSGGREAWGPDREEKSFVFCNACYIAFNEVLDSVAGGASPDVIFNMTIDICIDLNISSPLFCENMVQIAKPQLFWIIQNTEGLTGRDICGMVFVGEDCQSNNPDRVWEVELPNVPKPPLVTPVVPPGGPTIKVLHLADTHFDIDYLPGSNANCGERFFCCREESGEILHPDDAAGYWGDYRACDSPRWTLEALYTNVLLEHPDISFVIWTGDLVPHNVWNTSQESNLAIIREAVAMVQLYFPDIPVFPAIGNHEAHPVNAFPQPYIDNEFDISWLYDEIAALWSTWLPAEVADTIMYSAYYAVDIFPDLRILSVNTNYCYGFNWWLLYDSVDPGEVLLWMAAELQRAEDDGVLVYIISHIPSGHDDCTYTWSHEYNRIVARYESIIAGVFYGHTHKDHFQMFFDPEDPQRPTKVGFVAQSQTPYEKMNPGYKVYIIDGGRENATYTVLDHENWYFDLDQANTDGAPTFEVLYSAKEEYGMADLSPQSHLDLIYEMAEEGSPKFDLFYKNYVKAGRPSMEEGCDADCKHDILCRALVSDTSDRSLCDQVFKKHAPRQGGWW